MSWLLLEITAILAILLISLLKTLNKNKYIVIHYDCISGLRSNIQNGSPPVSSFCLFAFCSVVSSVADISLSELSTIKKLSMNRIYHSFFLTSFFCMWLWRVLPVEQSSTHTLFIRIRLFKVHFHIPVQDIKVGWCWGIFW